MIKTKENDMTDFNSVLAFVTLDADQTQLQNIIEAVNFRREKLARVAKSTLKVGQDVKFTSRGVNYAGKILSVRVKKATVQCTGVGLFAVPLSMLQAA